MSRRQEQRQYWENLWRALSAISCWSRAGQMESGNIGVQDVDIAIEYFIVVTCVWTEQRSCESSPSTVSIREKHNASLICKATGVSELKIFLICEIFCPNVHLLGSGEQRKMNCQQRKFPGKLFNVYLVTINFLTVSHCSGSLPQHHMEARGWKTHLQRCSEKQRGPDEQQHVPGRIS